MSVVAGLQSVAAGLSGSVQTQWTGDASGTQATDSSASSPTADMSFRSAWQSLLASASVSKTDASGTSASLDGDGTQNTSVPQSAAGTQKQDQTITSLFQTAERTLDDSELTGSNESSVSKAAKNDKGAKSKEDKEPDAHNAQSTADTATLANSMPAAYVSAVSDVLPAATASRTESVDIGAEQVNPPAEPPVSWAGITTTSQKQSAATNNYPEVSTSGATVLQNASVNAAQLQLGAQTADRDLQPSVTAETAQSVQSITNNSSLASGLKQKNAGLEPTSIVKAAAAMQASSFMAHSGTISETAFNKDQGLASATTASGISSSAAGPVSTAFSHKAILHRQSVESQNMVSVQGGSAIVTQGLATQNTVSQESAAAPVDPLHAVTSATDVTAAQTSSRAVRKLQMAESGNSPHAQLQTQVGDSTVVLPAIPHAGSAARVAIAGEGNSQTSVAAGATSRDAFAVLDTESGKGGTGAIHTDSRHAEAGFQDPVLGWIGIRADAGATGVHATLTSASSDAAQVLGGHMAGLNAYMAENHTPVETLTLATSGQQAGFGAEQSAGQAMGQGAGSHAGQQDSMPAVQESSIASSVIPLETTSGVSGWSSGGVVLEGTHISVVA